MHAERQQHPSHRRNSIQYAIIMIITITVIIIIIHIVVCLESDAKLNIQL